MALRLVALAVGAHYGVTEAITAVVLAQIVSTTAICILARRILREYPAAPSAAIGDDLPALRRFIVQSSVGSGLVSLRGTLGTVLLGIVSTPAQVGYYRNALAPQAGFAALSAPVRMILLSEQTRDFEEGRRGRLFRVLRGYILGTAGLMVVALPPLLWFMPKLVVLVYGGRYAPAGDAARLILLAAALQLIFGWTKSFPISIGRPALRIFAHGAEIAVLIPLTLVLGGSWGANGAATAVLLSTVAFAAVWTAMLFHLRRRPMLPARRPSDGLADEVVAP
jgi:O-antigen/teichoic acid export membrane protein